VCSEKEASAINRQLSAKHLLLPPSSAFVIITFSFSSFCTARSGLDLVLQTQLFVTHSSPQDQQSV